MPSPKSLPRRRVTTTEDEQSEHDFTTGHGFDTGHEVLLSRRYPPRKAAPGPYKVVAQLPARNGQFQYRIKSGCEPFFRIMAESELERV
ncbi:hypothetical protein AUC69_04370 [Methyloceanibacter superfactus]|uniref:Uncharacterized protein n=1 Tax=Methyloceanibacter superfactus TaxID=1774969 RepID=A0A1E3VJI0_9HYPH|nr:hypothetical protein [Methyloceanibacter superfactus]ODR93441.1 hypothetical protein AUC69_04370 [Methyloceanibacter superfactus]